MSRITLLFGSRLKPIIQHDNHWTPLKFLCYQNFSIGIKLLRNGPRRALSQFTGQLLFTQQETTSH